MTVRINIPEWKAEIEQRLANMIRKAFLEFLLINTVTGSNVNNNNRGRRKRLAKSGDDVQVDVS